MKSKLAKITPLLLAATIGFSSLIVASTYAADDICGADNVPEEIKRSSGCYGNAGTQLPEVVVNILNAIIAVSGLIAVIFIVVGGVQYMTSAGDAAKTKKAKDTILYALIGLIVCVLAFAIVNFVIYNILKA